MNATRYDETDLHRAVQAYKFFYPTVSGAAIVKGNEHVGLVANKVFGILDCGPEQLVHGELRHSLPMAPIAAVNADLTIAVSLSGSEAGGRYEPMESEPRATTEWLNRMWRSTSSLLDTNAARSLLDTRRRGPC